MAFWLSELDLPWQIEFAPYHQVFQQLLDPASHLAQNKKGINVVLVRFEDWLKSQDSLARIGDRPEEVEQEIERNRKDLLLALKSAAKRSSTPYLVCFCPPSPSFLEYGQGVTVLQQREDQLAEELKAIAGIYVTSHSELLGLYPVADYDNPGGNMLGHIPYTPLFFSALATIIARQVAAITTPPYKVIALDCDQTLWQGVCGEVGPEGIVIDTPWQKLQEFMVAQQEAGMLLCLCSKNNEEDVLTVFEQHPEMPLNLDHFVSRRINWKSKSENLKALAAELKLGLDSFIFIDDNPIECSEVQANCPAVLTLQLPQESSQIPHFLQHIWAFDRLKVTKEDRGRRELYRQNVQREHLRQESLTFEDFLAKLELQVDIKVITSADIPRVSQLTKRTNQFNATTIRRSEGEIQQLLESGQLDCLTVKVKDRFGDYGLVGVMLFGIQSDTLMVDSFLLSCRALGRGVEHQMLAKLGAIANELGLSWVELPYVQTQKNQPVRDFLQAVGSKYQQEQNGALRFRFPSKQIEGLSFKPETVETDKVSSSLSSQVSQEVSKGRVLSPLYQRIATELSTAEQVYQAVSSQKHWQKRALTEAYVAPRNSVEEKIAEIWGDVLKIEQVGINDNFFTVGGTSLLGIQVINRLGEVFQVELPLIKLFEKPTVAGIAECIDNIQSQNQKSTSVHSNLDEWVEGDRLRCNAPKGLLTDELSPKLAPRKTEIIHFLEESKQMSDSSLTNFLPPSPLVKIQPEGSKIPLFCVHPAGGYVLCYFDLGQYLGSDRPFYGLQSVGLDGQSEPLSRIEDMAACYIDAIKEIQPQGPYQLAGWSFGGLVAFEMAQQLHLQGQQVAFLGLIDTCTPSLQPPAPEDNVAVLLELFGDQLDLSSEILEQLEPDAQLLHVLEKAKQADMIPPDWGLEQARHLLKIFHCNVKASYSYLPQVYSGKITLFPANQEKSFSTNDPTLGWSEFTNQDLEIYSISGTHHDIVKTPQVKLLAELISQCVHAN
jgi:FkbH-like protein